MGPQNSKQQAPVQIRDPMDIQLDLRMTWKRLESESKRSLKEVDKNMAKAKEALKKNNEEGAKLFLQAAVSKKQESVNLQKMATKIQHVESQVKSSQANAQMIQQLSRVTPIMQQYTNNMSIEQVYSNISQFDQAIDDMMVQGKVVDNMMNKGNDYQTNAQVDFMMQQLRQEEQMKLQDLQPAQGQFQQLQQQQPQNQYSQQQQYYNQQQFQKY